jgi:hypothetical protein
MGRLVGGPYFFQTMAYGASGFPAFLASMKAELAVAQEMWPDIEFLGIREHAGMAEAETAA